MTLPASITKIFTPGTLHLLFQNWFNNYVTILCHQYTSAVSMVEKFQVLLLGDTDAASGALVWKQLKKLT